MPSPHRTSWNNLKKKHEAVLKEKKIVFDKDLGPLLDKIFDLRDKKDATTQKKAAEIAKKANGVIEIYQLRIRGKLGRPAEDEMRSQLNQIQSSNNSYIRNEPN